MSESTGSKSAANGVRMEVKFTRVFDAPRELVFQAWTDAKHLAQWWGPHGFTNPRCEWDARPGGMISLRRPQASGRCR